MKLLLDTCLSAAAKNDLFAAGHDVVWVGDRDPDPGDEAILAIVRGSPHHGIIRLVHLASSRQATLVLAILEKHGSEQYCSARL